MIYQPLVSIVTIVFNGEKYIEQAIKSVLGQSYKNIEYIIIDGGSEDNTINIIKKYEHRLAHWVSEKDKGISDAFNKGIAKAKGEIIGILNSDDWYESGTVNDVASSMHEYDVAYGDIQYWRDDEKSFMQKGNVEYLEKESSILHPTVFVKRYCYEQIGIFDLRYRCAMDYDFLLRLKVHNYQFIYLPKVLTNMRWEGFSDKQWLLGRKELLAIKNHYFPGRKISNYLFFYRNALAIMTIKFIERLHLDFLVRYYRQRFSKIRKTYN